MIGTLTRATDSGEQLGQRLRVRRCDRVEGAAMPARRCALHGNGVDAAVHRRVRFLDGGHGADRGDARVAEPLAFLGARQAERERRHLGPQVEQDVELGRPGVVVVDRITQLGPVALRIGRQRRGVLLDPVRGGGAGLRGEQVDAERAGGQLACGDDALGKRIGGQVAGRDEPQSARIGTGGGELGRRRTARHRCDDHRNRKRPHVKTARHHRLPSVQWVIRTTGSWIA